MPKDIITTANVYDEKLFKKTMKLYVQTIKMLNFINKITFRIFENRLLYQSELAGKLAMKSIEENINNTQKNVFI